LSAEQDKPQVLEPAQIAEGRVTAADTGQPLPGARTATVAWHQIDTTGFSIITHPGAPTDAEGRLRPLAHTAQPKAMGRRDLVEIGAPPGQPYLGVRKEVAWPKGTVRQTVDITLPRGVLVRGKATEGPDAKPVAEAAIIFHPQRSSAFFPPEE